MASPQRRPPDSAADPSGLVEVAAVVTGDDTDLAKHKLDEAARLAKDYLDSAAQLASDFLASSGPSTEGTGEGTLATAERVAAELLATAEESAEELLATARQVAVARLTSAHRFEAMFHDHDAVMLLIDPDTGEIVDANPSAAAFYGYPVEAFRSMPITQINTLPSDDVAGLLVQTQDQGHGHFVFSHRLASGEIRRVDVHASPISDGRPLLFSIIVDIENRMRAEEELARQRQRLQLVMSASQLGMWDWNMVTGETVFDERWAEIGGYRLADLGPVSVETWRSLCHPDDLAASDALIVAHAQGRTPFYDFECRLRHRDGHWAWVHDRGEIVEWTPDGRPVRMTGTHEDVSGAHRAAEELAAAEEESRLAFDRSRVATCLVSNEGRLLRVNPAISDLLGRSEADLLTMNFLDVTHPDDVAVGADLIRDLLAGRRPSLRLTKRYVTGGGRVIWGDVTVSAVLDEDGTMRHRIAQILDVTAEHDLRESLLEAERIAHLGGWKLDVATGAVVWSPALYAMFGLDPTGSVPDYDEQQRLFMPESWQRLNTAVAQALETGAPYELELQTVRTDGTHGWVQARGEAIRDANDVIVEVHGISLDITDRKSVEEKLADSEETLRVVLDTSRETTIRTSIDGRVKYVNQRGVEISGIPFEQWIGRTFTEMGYPAELVQSWDANRNDACASGKPVTFEFEIDNSEGHRWYETNIAPEVDADGTTRHVIETSRDITERKAAETALSAGRAQLEQAQRIAHIGSWTLDNATNHVTWSEELYLMQGLDPASPVPDYTEHSRLFTPASWQELSAALAVAQEAGDPYELELEMVRPDGSHGWMLARGEALHDAGGAIVGLQGVALDITDRKAASDELQILATHDPLTGLANRAALLDEITRAVSAGRRTGRSTAVLMMDLDRFKDVNDTLGHAAGDDLLVAAAARVEHVVRAGDLVARIGGDEFVVVMRDLDDLREAVGAAERLTEEFRTPFILRDAELYSTASIGLALATDTTDAGDLLREADTAMYAAKETGRDRVSVFNEDLRTAAAARRTVETDLRHALERGQLTVWYQPEVDLRTGAVIAVETLLRWHHPDGDVWTADRFIDVAEDTGLILDIGDWVLRQACSQAAVWATARPGQPLTVRVNVSALQLAETGLLPAIDDALATSGLDPRMLCLEITETAMLRQTTAARDNLDGIHHRGIGIAIDDFGTGYASLTYLSHYPIDVIKIDRSFITDTAAPDHDHRLVAGIIALAKVLGITVTAEGVEHPDQATHLREMGCPSAQGFLYSPAVPVDQIAPLLNHTYPHT